MVANVANILLIQCEFYCPFSSNPIWHQLSSGSCVFQKDDRGSPDSIQSKQDIL